MTYSLPRSAWSRRDRSYAAIDLGALASNYARLRARAGGRDVIAVVKADAYGHGAVPVVRRLRAEGCRRFAVAVLSEAAELRRDGIDVPLLLLSGVGDAAEARAALALGVEPVAHTEGQVGWLEAAAQALDVRAGVHVEVDTGMRRFGVPAASAPGLLARIAASPRLRLAGVSMHFACADEPDPSTSREQLARFRDVLAAARAAGVEPEGVHVSNSAALLAVPMGPEAVPMASEARAMASEAGAMGPEAVDPGDAVRPGLALYGVAPSVALADPALRPVMTLCSEIATVRAVAAGEGVGYGHTWHAPQDGFLATLPIGYADGIPWSGARAGCVSIAGARRPLAGRVSMDSITVWLASERLPVGAPALIFGDGDGDGTTRIGVEEWAAAAGTIPYELLVRVGNRVPRRVRA